MPGRKRHITRAIRQRALDMYGELLERKLEVVLTPAPEPTHIGHYVRTVVNQPPGWFSQFAGRYMRSKLRQRARPNFIKRNHTLRALLEISEGQAKTLYAQRWLEEIKRQLADELEQVPF